MDSRHSGRKLAAAAMLGALLTACGGGSGDGLDSNGRPVGEGGSGGGGLTPTFASIQAQVLTPRCTTCHAGAAAPVGLRLDAGSSYALLVGVPSGEVSSLQRVAPGRPDDSYLIHKLEGRAAVGSRMPLGGPFLDAATIAVIRDWIARGAPNN
ncbi:hypothetical protein HLB44_02425 [Aquincola sp. S2]|uniref:Cytochrome c domain-containing protein n=1 Tax=Pseudaquabacterium terrae TaxID=2732868 RepID=A0ABX2EAH1_9BURK|nr:hypothetical protein [Aquabacterium terrae]NRF65835.1 hypothetical protein [Aquabacterium terrae]